MEENATGVVEETREGLGASRLTEEDLVAEVTDPLEAPRVAGERSHAVARLMERLRDMASEAPDRAGGDDPSCSALDPAHALVLALLGQRSGSRAPGLVLASHSSLRAPRWGPFAIKQ